ncbi:MAG: hypothetical protein ACI9JY_001793, partial [Saprospiraceae bacterium]
RILSEYLLLSSLQLGDEQIKKQTKRKYICN